VTRLSILSGSLTAINPLLNMTNHLHEGQTYGLGGVSWAPF
jgi:hypothetical protein